MYHGMINVYKEKGYTSHDVVARLRGICKQKKIGHTGTLDPDAVGVLPVCLGNGTRLCELLTDRSKEYVAQFRLGLVTDTQDISGKVLEEKEVSVSPEEVREAILSFQGESMQVPPMYSALKVGGKKLCDLARAGKEVERAPRPITIYSLEILDQKHPDYTIRVSCSKGTYIRTLCHDVGRALGCGAVMTVLTRTRVGEFQIGDTWTLDRLQDLAGEGRLDEAVIPVDKVFEALPSLTVEEEGLSALRNGNPLRMEWIRQGANPRGEKDSEVCVDVTGGAETEASPHPAQEFRIYSGGNVFYGIYRYDRERALFVPVKMFLPEGG